MVVQGGEWAVIMLNRQIDRQEAGCAPGRLVSRPYV